MRAYKYLRVAAKNILSYFELNGESIPFSNIILWLDFFMEKCMNIDIIKKLAAEKAVEEIKDGMVVGLGTGTTFHFALLKIAERIKSGELKNIICVASSKQTEQKAAEIGVPIVTLNELFSKKQSFEKPMIQPIDIYIDGADEVDADLNLIKGGGGALLREKIVAQASKRFIVMVDETKLSHKLGMNFAIPIEVLQFAVEAEKSFLESHGSIVTVRKRSDVEQSITDEGNLILDAKVNAIENVNDFSLILERRAGIVEHGLFRRELVSEVICAMKDGTIKLFGNSVS